MAIVNFEQDPTAPVGTGNFRDDKGRIMYLHDPETAAQFIPTMRGAPSVAAPAAPVSAPAPDPLAAPGGATAALVGPTGGAPAPPTVQTLAMTPDTPNGGTRQLDMRAGRDDPGSIQPLAAAANRLATGGGGSPAPGGPPAPAAPPAVTSAAAINPPGPGNGVVALEGATLTAPAPPATPPAPPGTPPGAGGAGAQLVSALDASKAQLDPRTQPQPPLPEPPNYGTMDLPPAAVNEGEQIAIKEGRALPNVLAEIADVEGVEKQGDDLIRRQYDEQTAANKAATARGQRGIQAEYGRQTQKAFEARAQRERAEANVLRLEDALEKNDKSEDPDRVVRNMSSGKKLGMILLAGLTGGFNALAGGDITAVQKLIDDEIDTDIKRQKDEIASGRVRTQNLIQKFMTEGHDAKTSELLARDYLDGAVAQMADLESKRLAADAVGKQQMELALQQRAEVRANKRAEVLRGAEAEVNRTRNAERRHARPEPIFGANPQAQLAQIEVDQRRIELENAQAVADAVGHSVSIDEARQIKTDSQHFGDRVGKTNAAKSDLRNLARALGLDPDTFAGDPDPGLRPLGVPDEKAREIDRLYALVKRADIMNMTREPSNDLQREFGGITARPFYDTDIPTQLKTLRDFFDRAEREAAGGYSDDARNYYSRARVAPRAGNRPPPAAAAAPRPAPARPPAPRAAAPGRPAPARPAAAQAPAAAEPEAPKKLPGNLRVGI